METIKKVRTIPAKTKFESDIKYHNKRKVCGYARVSTDLDEQATSYKAQVDYYTSYIKSNPTWEFVGLYSDEGISGTNTKKRDGFNRMIKDALDGKIDLIITKSISRFARNTVDALVNIRKLKESNVEVYFEKENIYSLDSKGELMLSLLSSLAQEESRSISLNTTWGKRKSFADGKVSIAFSNFLGYDRGEDGKLVVNKEQAEVVKLIYKLFVKGLSSFQIKKELEHLKIKTPMGKTNWRTSTILSLLRNEKYKGDALLQKRYTVDFLTKKQKLNDGEIPQYYVEDNHEAIIDKRLFDYVQVELKKRGDAVRKGHKITGKNIFSGKIFCAECGANYGRKIIHSNDKYRQAIYRCNEKYDGKKCSTMTINEKMVEEAFVTAYNNLDKKEIRENYNMIIEKLTNIVEQEEKLKKLKKQLEEVIKENDKLILKNTREVISENTFNKKRLEISNTYYKIEDKIKSLNKEIEDRKNRATTIKVFLSNIKIKNLQEFDSDLFAILVDRVEVSKDKIIIIWKGEN